MVISPKKSACGKIPISNRACQIQGWSFSPEKCACGKLVSSKRASQIMWWSFSPKKGACGKLVSSNRACRILGVYFHRKESDCGKLFSSDFHQKKAPAASFLAATGLVRSRPKIGPNPKPSQVQILVDQSSGSGQKHQTWSEMGRESTVWPETWSK